MADRALAGGNPSRAFYQASGQINRASACEAECCGDCRLWWLANPCPVPEPDPNDPCPGTVSGGGAPSPIIVAQDSVCIPQGVVQPGFVILWNGYCYTITNQVRRRPIDTGCPPDIQVSSLPTAEGVLVCTACSSQLCYQFTSGYAVAIPCDPVAMAECGPIRFCRRELVDLGVSCVYAKIGCGGQTPWCYKFDLTNPDSTDPNARTISLNALWSDDPTNRYISCCLCNSGSPPQSGLCVTGEVPDTWPIPSTSAPCCCGEYDRWRTLGRYIIDEDTFEQITDDGNGTIQRIYTTLDPAPQAFIPDGSVQSIQYRQRIYLNGVLCPFPGCDVLFTVGFAFDMCSPLARILINAPPWGTTSIPDGLNITYSATCEMVSLQATWPLSNGTASWTFRARMVVPSINPPCFGDCAGQNQGRASSPQIVRWLGLDWYGQPAPLRLWNALLGRKEKPSGCGCIKPLKDRAESVRTMWGDWRGRWPFNRVR